jgi:hypothetical protein
MLFTEDFVKDFVAHLKRMGLGEPTKCVVCGSEDVRIDRRPLVAYVGGGPQSQDRTTNLAFMARILCEMCGHVMLFDVEKFAGSDEAIYVRE